MTLVLRTIKGSALTNAELDNNFTFLNNSTTALSNAIDVINDETIPALQTDVDDKLALKQNINPKLGSLSSVSTTGVLAINGDVITPREIVPGSPNIVVNNGSGIEGNPTIDIAESVATLATPQVFTNKTISGTANNIINISLTSSVVGTLPLNRGGTNATSAVGARASLGALVRPTGTGIVVQTATDTTAVRGLLVSGSGLSVTNGTGVVGNPTISLASTPSNLPDTVVYRNSVGSFEANQITASQFNGPLNGNASTVTNGVYTNQSYSNPTWLTSLAGTKVTSIPNTSLQNNTITINGTAVPLGGSIAVPSDLLPVTTNNVGNTIVARNALGGFAAGTITASLQGNVTGNVTGNVAGNTVGTHTGQVIGNVTGTASGNLPNSGGALSGYLTLHANPINPLHAATKQYVDAAVSGAAKPIWAGVTTPANAQATYAGTSVGTVLVVYHQFSFTEAYFWGNGTGYRTVNQTDVDTYIKTAPSNTWLLISRLSYR